MNTPFETDAAGNLIPRPVLGWATAAAAGTTVILRMEYAETPAEVKTGGRAIQLTLTPQQAQDLAQSLINQAARLLGQPIPLGPKN